MPNRVVADRIFQARQSDGLTFTMTDLQDMAATLATPRPHVHTFHPEGGLCIDCGTEAQRVWQVAGGWGHGR